MGIMTGGVVCPTAAKKCEVKLERLSPSASGAAAMDSNKFKRPLSSIKSSEDGKDSDPDLRPPVKLKVRLNSKNASVVKPSSQSKASSNEASSATKLEASSNNNNVNTSSRLPLKKSAQISKYTARGGGPMGGEKGGAAAASQAPQPQTLKKKLPPYKPAPAPPMFDPHLKSDELQVAVKKLGFDPKGNLSTSLMDGVNITSPVPEPPTRPAVALTDEELLPPTPCVYVNDASEAFSPQLLDVCLRRPIVVVRNIASACGMDLSLYT